MNSTLQLLATLDRLSQSKQTQVEPLNPASLVWYKIRKAYEQQKRRKKQRQSQNTPQIFTLVRRPSIESKQRYNAVYQKNLISPQIHNNSMRSQDIIGLITILKYVSKVANIQQLEECILRKISQLRSSQEVLETFLKFLFCPVYLKGGYEQYKIMEMRMIKIMLNFRFNNCNPAIVVKFVRSLPFLKQNIMELLSYLLEEVSDPEAVTFLYSLFLKLFDESQITQEKIRWLIRVPTHQAVEKVYSLAMEGKLDINLLEEEAKQKLKKIPKQFNEQGRAMLSFVFFVVAHGGAIWTDIIEWEISAKVQYKDYLKDKAQNIIKDSSIKHDYLLIILLKLTGVDHVSEIAEIFLNHVLSQRSNQLLSTPIVRKFLASKLIYKLASIRQNPTLRDNIHVVFNTDLDYVDVLIQLLNNQRNSFVFFSYFLQNPETSQTLTSYLDILLVKKQAKFKTFFLKCHTNKELLEFKQRKLMYYFLTKMPIQLVYTAIKQMSARPPAFYYMLYIKGWLNRFKSSQQYTFVRNCVIRNLNIILTRTDLELCSQFVHDFAKLRKQNEFTPKQLSQICQNIPSNRLPPTQPEP